MNLMGIEMNDYFSFLDLNVQQFHEQPVVCFSTDLEWSPEWAISELLEIFVRYQVPLTPFITHKSEIINKYYGNPEMKYRVGLHPNFFPKSSHGDTYLKVIDYVHNLWPESTGFRSHCFFDHTHITNNLAKRGFRYDSNLCLFLQKNCVPLKHNSGLIRFPVFWEDDIHYWKKMPFSIEFLKKYFDNAGLKVFNIHPLHVLLNVPNHEYYFKHKYLYDEHDPNLWKRFVFSGKGTRTLLEDIIVYFKNKDYCMVYMYDLFKEISAKSIIDKYPKDM